MSSPQSLLLEPDHPESFIRFGVNVGRQVVLRSSAPSDLRLPIRRGLSGERRQLGMQLKPRECDPSPSSLEQPTLQKSNSISSALEQPTLQKSNSISSAGGEANMHTDPEELNDPLSNLSIGISPDITDGTDLQLELADINFDVLKIRNAKTLRAIAYYLISTGSNLEAISVQRSVLWEFILGISLNYRPNPFHNFHHAVSVLHFTYQLLESTRLSVSLSVEAVFALLISAIAHDLDHRGRTNLFEINSESDLAIFYNDISVLENHHCSQCFFIMQKPGRNVLARATSNQKKEIRNFIIAFILATDMSKHSDLIDSTKDVLPPRRGQILELPQQLLFGKLFLHGADLSGPAKPFAIAEQWSRLVTEEFNQQVEQESRLGLPVLAFMASGDEKKFLQNEIGFYSFFVSPLWRSVEAIFPELSFISNQLEDNITKLKRRKSRIEEGNQAQK